MTEAEWNAHTDPMPMLRFLRGKASDRKLRLFVCACCRHVLESRPSIDHDLQGALTIAENLADGLLNQKEALQARCQLESISPYSEKWSAFSAVSAALDKEVSLAAECAVRHSVNHFGCSKTEHPTFLARILRIGQLAPRKPLFQPAAIVRDMFGNPFRPVSTNPSWLIPTVTDLARSIYQQRAFERLPTLADALIDAGCNNEAILNHCQDGGEHCRGCWVVDLVLGKQ